MKVTETKIQKQNVLKSQITINLEATFTIRRAFPLYSITLTSFPQISYNSLYSINLYKVKTKRKYT